MENNVINNNNAVNNISFSNLTPEQLQMITQFANDNDIKISPKKTRNIDNLKYVDDSHKIAICNANENHQFDITQLDEETLQKCKRLGLCPDCLNILDEAANIKQHITRTRKFVNNQPSEDKAGYQIREIVKSNINNINDDLLIKLMDHDFCKATFKLSYPLLLDINNKTADEIKVMRKDSKGHPRYSPQEYVINDQKYLLTNNLYPKNLNLIRDFFDKL